MSATGGTKPVVFMCVHVCIVIYNTVTDAYMVSYHLTTGIHSRKTLLADFNVMQASQSVLTQT
jgi:hypothetical protein